MRRPLSLVPSALVALLALAVSAGCNALPSTVGAASTTDALTPAVPRVVVLGDSYTVDSAGGAGYVPPVAEAMEWATTLEAQDGTGYLAPGLTADSAPYGERLEDVVADRPDLVLVQGSTNDVGSSAAELRTAADQLYAALAARLPAAQIVVLGPLTPPGVDRAGVSAVRDVLAQAASAAGLNFIDPVAGGWLMPTEGLFADPVHPNEAGYQQLADELVTALQADGF